MKPKNKRDGKSKDSTKCRCIYQQFQWKRRLLRKAKCSLIIIYIKIIVPIRGKIYWIHFAFFHCSSSSSLLSSSSKSGSIISGALVHWNDSDNYVQRQQRNHYFKSFFFFSVVDVLSSTNFSRIYDAHNFVSFFLFCFIFTDFNLHKVFPTFILLLPHKD